MNFLTRLETQLIIGSVKYSVGGRGEIVLSDNEKNFINSKDIMIDKYNIPIKILYLCFPLFLCAVEILFFCFNITFIGKKATLLDFIIAVIIATFGLADFFASFFVAKDRFVYMYFGNLWLLISAHLCYIAIRLALFPLSEFYGLLGLSLWIIISIICICGIFDNIKNDRYQVDCSNICWFKDEKTDETCGFVVSKFVIISAGIIFFTVVAITVIYSLNPKLFTASKEALFSRVCQISIVSILLILCYIGNFAWKLIIKQVYLNKLHKKQNLY